MGIQVVLRLPVAQAETLAWVYEAASKDEGRPVLQGIQFEWETTEGGELELTVVTTDSYMLCRRVYTFEADTFIAEPAEGKVLVRGKELAEALKASIKVGKKQYADEMQDTILQLEDDAAHVASADGSQYTVVKTIDGEFPKWRSLMPDGIADGEFNLPAISPKLIYRMTRCIAQPASKLGEGLPVRIRSTATSSDKDTALTPWLFSIPNGSANLGAVDVLVMPVRL